MSVEEAEEFGDFRLTSCYYFVKFLIFLKDKFFLTSPLRKIFFSGNKLSFFILYFYVGSIVIIMI